MCRSPPRLLRVPPFQHAGFANSRLAGRHLSSLRTPDRSVAVANTRSIVPILGYIRHASRPSSASSFPFYSVINFTYFSRSSANVAAATLLQSYSQFLARGTASSQAPEDVAMAKKTNTDVRPAEVLNGDVDSSAAQAKISLDPESDEDVPVEPEELKEALGRPPPVNSSYLPLPWKGRLGYVSHAFFCRESPAPGYGEKS